jgi:hypothetical protein
MFTAASNRPSDIVSVTIRWDGCRLLIETVPAAVIRIPIIETNTKRRLVFEVKLVAPWSGELRSVGQTIPSTKALPVLEDRLNPGSSA